MEENHQKENETIKQVLDERWNSRGDEKGDNKQCQGMAKSTEMSTQKLKTNISKLECHVSTRSEQK